LEKYSLEEIVLSSGVGSSVYPETLKVLDEVFDSVWQQIPRAVGDANAETLRSEIARMILAAHASGLPPQEIKEFVLTKIGRSDV
jgi:hypothetical protein